MVLNNVAGGAGASLLVCLCPVRQTVQCPVFRDKLHLAVEKPDSNREWRSESLRTLHFMYLVNYVYTSGFSLAFFSATLF